MVRAYEYIECGFGFGLEVVSSRVLGGGWKL